MRAHARLCAADQQSKRKSSMTWCSGRGKLRTLRALAIALALALVLALPERAHAQCLCGTAFNATFGLAELEAACALDPLCAPVMLAPPGTAFAALAAQHASSVTPAGAAALLCIVPFNASCILWAQFVATGARELAQRVTSSGSAGAPNEVALPQPGVPPYYLACRPGRVCTPERIALAPVVIGIIVLTLALLAYTTARGTGLLT